MRSRFTITILLAAALAGCSDSLPTSRPEQGTILPLEVGHWWLGRLTVYDRKGQIVKVSDDLLEVQSAEIIDGETWYRTNKSDPNIGGLITTRPDGAWIRYKFGNTIRLQQNGKFPARVGEIFGRDTLDRFDSNGKPLGEAEQYSSVVSTRHAVTVPAGTFICHQYRSQVRPINGASGPYQIYIDQYYAPGVGNVLTEFFMYDADGAPYVSKRWELVKCGAR